MNDFLNLISHLISFILIVVFFILIVVLFFILITALIFGFNYANFYISKSLDTSTGMVYCDNKPIYNGRLYVVEKTLETDNLQSPMFTIIIKNKNNPFKIEKRYFCKDLKIVED